MGAIYGFTGPPDTAQLERMSAALAHRGTARVDVHEGESGSLGYRGPAPRAGGAGLWSDGERTIALAGELLSGQDLPALLEAYDAQGPAFVSGLRGAFALAILDGPRLCLFRDGAGMRSLSYGEHAGRLYFAVEPKGVLAISAFPRRLRAAAIARFLSFSFQPGAGTMLEDLFDLPAGHWLARNARGRLTLERWFVFEDVEPEDLDDEAWVARFRAEHARAVRERLDAGGEDEPVGLFLSGGIDSSIVTAEVARQRARPVRTWAIHFGPEYPHELEFARSVAQRCGTEHEEVELRPRGFLPRLREIIWHLDDPIGDPVTVPNFELAARASREVSRVFNGEGGDPCFGGPKNIPMMLHHWYGGVPRGPRFREQRYLASFRRAYEEVTRLLTPEWRARIDMEADLEELLTPYFAAARPARLLDKLTAMNIRLKGARLILPKVERMTGAFGVTPLSPLFDERLVRLAFALPPGLRLAGGVEKIVLKRAYREQLPASVIDRPKSGMRVPVHYWFQGEMKRYCAKILGKRSLRQAGIFDERRVQQLLDYDIDEGPGRYGLKLWMLTTFEIWRRLTIEGEAR